MTTPEVLTRLAEPWAHFYSHSKAASTIVTFLHIAPIVVGGGIAIALDRATLRLDVNDAPARERHLRELGSVHPIVLWSLALLANGARMTRLERTLAGSAGAAGDQWRRLRGIAITSVILWLAITLAGVVLTSIA